MSARHKPLRPAEIAMLMFVASRCGLTGRMQLSRTNSARVVSLWRRGLVEKWLRCVPDEGVKRAAGYGLSIEGHKLASAFIAARDERRAKLKTSRVKPQQVAA